MRRLLLLAALLAPALSTSAWAQSGPAPLRTAVDGTFAPHAFADAVAGSYRGAMIYKVWIAQEAEQDGQIK